MKPPLSSLDPLLHGLISSYLLNLAISIRINLYQKKIENVTYPLEVMAADYYEDDELICKEVTLKDICDKIIHADTVYKPVMPNGLLENDVRITFQLRGVNRKKAWTLNICLEILTVNILALLDEIESRNK